VLLTDLFEGGNVSALFRRLERIQRSGAQLITLLAISDEGVGAYDHQHAERLGQMGIPTFGCTPDQFPALMAAAISRQPLNPSRFDGTENPN
jgi:hypothetical protein